MACDTPKVVIDRREQPIRGVGFTRSPRHEQPGDFVPDVHLPSRPGGFAGQCQSSRASCAFFRNRRPPTSRCVRAPGAQPGEPALTMTLPRTSMRIDTACQLACLTVIAACADGPTPPSTRPEGARPLGSVMLKYPGEDAGPPFYALVEHSFLPHTDEWAPIVFVRDPACVASTFNLLDQLAVPDAFGCPSSVEGHVTYKNGP